MAGKTKATLQKAAVPEKETREAPDTPLPLLDLSDAAVKKLIRTAKKRGYVTHDQINSVLPSEEVNSDEEQGEEPEEETESESASPTYFDRGGQWGDK